MKIVVFGSNQLLKVQDHMNAFLKEIDDVNVINMNISSSGHDTYIAWIQYKEAYKPQ